MYKKVVVIGSIAFDDIMDFPGVFGDYILPDKIHQLNVSFVVDVLEKQMGGTALNISYNMHLMQRGLPYLLSSMGKDHEVISDWLKKNKIDTKGILIDKELYTATGKAITDKNDNQIWGFYYGASISSLKISPGDHIGKQDVAILSAHHPKCFGFFQEYLVSNNIDYLYDPGMTLTFIGADILKKGVWNAKWLVANDYEMTRITEITGYSTDELIKHGVKVITTLGDKGVRYADKEHLIEVPAYAISNPVDPTGAGDAWRGGFMAGIVAGSSIEDSVIQANALASFAVEKYGTVNHAPTKKDMKLRMEAIRKNY